MYQIIGEYLEYLELEKGLSQNTLEAYRRDLSEFSQGVEDITKVDRMSINMFIRKLRENQQHRPRYLSFRRIRQGSYLGQIQDFL